MPVIYRPKGKALEYSELACNLYNGCIHGCRYCYAPRATFKDPTAFHKVSRPRPHIVERLRLEADKLNPAKTPAILLCFTCDPYQPGDSDTTRQAVEALKARGLRVQILTKGGSRAIRDLDLLGSEDCFATTLTFINAEDSKKWEPMAASPTERMMSLATAKERGIRTWVSLEPVIDPEQSLEIIDKTYEFVDLYRVGKLNHSPDIEQGIDWANFARRAVDLIAMYGKGYYIKKDLAAYL